MKTQRVIRSSIGKLLYSCFAGDVHSGKLAAELAEIHQETAFARWVTWNYVEWSHRELVREIGKNGKI